MIQDLEAPEASAEFDCDILIVGAGAVGITMAAALARQGRNVMLVEGGGASLESRSQALYQGVSVGHALDGLLNGRFRQLGGTTNFWGGQLVRFDPIVFQPRPWLPYGEWPFGRELLDPYYEQVLALTGMAGCSRDDADTLARVNVQIPDLGDDIEIFLTRWLRDPNFAQLFRRDLEGAGLRTLVHANVVGFDVTGGAAGGAARIKAVRLRTLTGRDASVRAQRVVLACGTIEISRLLLLPLADGSPAPWANNDWIGRGFMDHVDSVAGEVKPINRKAFHELFDNIYLDRYKYNPKIKLSENAQNRYQLLGISAQFNFASSYSDHLGNLKIFIRALLNGRLPSNLTQMPTHIAGLWRVAVPLALRYLKSSRAFNPADAGIFLRLTSEQWPNRNGRISLRPETDALGIPIVEVDWAIDGRELETIAAFAENIREELTRCGLADVELDSRLVARDPSFLTGVDDGFHQMGGARMAVSPNEGVVDPDLRVHGTENLYVAGAAVFPSSGFPNPTFTAMALGQKLVKHLKA